MKKVNNMLTATVILCPADRISSGNISLGTSHPNGPHDHAKAETNKQIHATTIPAYHFGNSITSPDVPNLDPIKTASATCTCNINLHKISK